MRRILLLCIIICVTSTPLALILAKAEPMRFEDLVPFLIKTIKANTTKDELIVLFGEPSGESEITLQFWEQWQSTTQIYAFDNGQVQAVTVILGMYNDDHVSELFNNYLATRRNINKILGDQRIGYYYDDLGIAACSWNNDSGGVILSLTGTEQGYCIIVRFNVTHEDVQYNASQTSLDKVVPIGEYIVGKHIPAGDYSLSFVDYECAFFVYEDDHIKASYAIKKGANVGRVVLSEGQTVKINFGSIRFTNVNALW